METQNILKLKQMPFLFSFLRELDLKKENIKKHMENPQKQKEKNYLPS